jgi:hypothetical protein
MDRRCWVGPTTSLDAKKRKFLTLQWLWPFHHKACSQSLYNIQSYKLKIISSNKAVGYQVLKAVGMKCDTVQSTRSSPKFQGNSLYLQTIRVWASKTQLCFQHAPCWLPVSFTPQTGKQTPFLWYISEFLLDYMPSHFGG